MIELVISYWHSEFKDLPWKDGDTFNFESKKEYRKKLSKILARIDAAGYNAMIINQKLSYLKLLYISDDRFRQR